MHASISLMPPYLSMYHRTPRYMLTFVNHRACIITHLTSICKHVLSYTAIHAMFVGHRACIDIPDASICSTYRRILQYTLKFVNHRACIITHVTSICKHVPSYTANMSNTNNFSDDSAVKCVIDNDLHYFVQNGAKKGGQKTACHKSNEMDIKIYQERVDHYIGNIHLPESAMLCTDTYCQVQLDDITKFHDDIINALLTASQKSIPRDKPACSKLVHG